MEWTQFIILIVAMAGMFYWNRTEARADSRHFDNESKAIRRDLIEVMRESKEDIKTLAMAFQASIDSIKQESKDFHARLCVIEERRK